MNRSLYILIFWHCKENKKKISLQFYQYQSYFASPVLEDTQNQISLKKEIPQPLIFFCF